MQDISDKITPTVKYPRFFTIAKGKWFEIPFLRIDEMGGPVYRVYKDGKTKEITTWTEGNCEFNVLNGMWKEIDESEAALII